MEVFLYEQYLNVIHTLRLNAVLQLAEESTNYQLSEKNNDKIHDKLVKNILKDKIEIASFINSFIEEENIQSSDLIKFTNSYITNKYKSKEADLVYKLKDEEIFFLIEHQSTIDISMPYRILNYCIDIMHEWSKSKRFKEIKSYPIIVPIVIYTGDKKWKVPQNFKEKQISTAIFQNYKIEFKYNLIDINNIPDEYLLSLNTMFGNAMFIEKAKDKEDLIQRLQIIIKHVTGEDELEEIRQIILYALNGALDNIEQEQLIKQIDEKVGEKYMATLIDRLTEENRRVLNEGIQKGLKVGIEEGKKAGIKTGMKVGIAEGSKTNKIETVKRMLSMNFEEDIILKVSDISKEELRKIKIIK